MDYLVPAKAILLEEQLRYFLTSSLEHKGVYTFPKGICLKVNVIAHLEYELAYYDSVAHRFNHYTTRTCPTKIWKKYFILKDYSYYKKKLKICDKLTVIGRSVWLFHGL